MNMRVMYVNAPKFTQFSKADQGNSWKDWTNAVHVEDVEVESMINEAVAGVRQSVKDKEPFPISHSIWTGDRKVVAYLSCIDGCIDIEVWKPIHTKHIKI
jgi:hypothetical protein